MSNSEDLDARILDAEARLIERETRVREGLAAVREHVSSAAARPQRWLAPALGSVAALVVLRRLLRKRRGHADQAEGATASQHQAQHAPPPFPWVRLTALLWPMLPDQWRARVPTPLVNFAIVAAPFLPLISQHLARRRQHRGR